ncbi:unnamed protein product [Ostreobium quekettii]|uniref:DNA polymerase n=1 Tax=Ostreobium quekettii TaxID=121088 RepID=A0A8S1IP82_9CHLO|nr:unnamed protein product [Ostreobium quekettii]|eukprot:evm.model.scf_121.6 EVM.evm.TU.scf_121.6   scf_121:50475-64994(-)
MEVDVGEAGRSWPRPPLREFDPARDPLVFQQLEVDYTNEGRKAVVRMYGVTEEGNSVCTFVHDFEAYFYIKAPMGFSQDDIDALQAALNAHPVAAGFNVVRIEQEMKSNVWTYQFGQLSPFLKIVVNIPQAVTKFRGVLEGGGVVANGIVLENLTTYESSVLYALRFMIDSGMPGASWVELPAGTYSLVPEGSHQTTCQLEAKVRYDSIINHPPEGRYSMLAPLRILSVDIECAGRKGQFPDPKLDSVIQIASYITVQGQNDAIVKNVLTLNSCAPIVGAVVESFSTERELLLRWRDLMLIADPDVIIGYNICNFDLPYLLERGRTLRIDREFEYWGRQKQSRIRMRDSKFSSKAYGTHEYKEITIDGRIQLDMLLAIQRDHKLSSYSLNSVSAHFLGEQKEDVHHSIITDLQNGNAETRRRLAVYCLKDAYLPQRLVDKLMYMYNYVEMARVTGVPMSYLLTRGQSIKVFSQILRKARSRNFLVPNLKKMGQTDGVAYEGATVLEAKQGFYENPVATLDFASLYPSIMMAHNLCYTTLVPKHRVNELPPGDVETSPSGDTFVRTSRQKGLLPDILEELLAARKRAKADLKIATDPFVKAVMNGRQLALKVSANSVYGFTGATVGKLPCLEISSTVTAYGRQMILQTQEMVTKKYNRSNGLEQDCDVIYGDTDSVMVNFKVKDVKRAMDLGKEAAEYISQTFPKPVKLEFEKVYYPYLLMSKKRYAGLLWTNPNEADKMDTKGIESVRRDNCLLVRQVVTTCLEMILMQRNVAGAVEYVKNTISDLLMNRLDLSLLVVSKGLTQNAETYENKAAHVELAKKMRKRDPATAPGVGDRVAYVIIKAAKGARAYEKAEDPIYALTNNLPIDYQHYLDHHLAQPLTRLFEPILGNNAKELLQGSHTRSISVSTPSAASGGIMRFAKKTATCLGCKTPLVKDSVSPLCGHCQPREAQILTSLLAQVNDLESHFGRLWTQCQACQGSLHQDVLCTSRDCPIFYRRKKVQKDLGEVKVQLARFPDW